MNGNPNLSPNKPHKTSKLPYIIGCSILFIGFLFIFLAIGGGAYLYLSQDSFFKESTSNPEYFGKFSVPKTQTIRYAVNYNFEAKELDPHHSNLNKIVPALFDGLAEYSNNTTSLTPSLATKWEKNTDATVWTFYIRKDAKWSNGTPITAKDFVYSWKRALNPKTSSQMAFMLYDIKNAEEYNTSKGKAEDVGIEAPDDHTLRVKLKQPTPYFDKLIAASIFRPVPQKTIESFISDWIKPQNIVTSGAFKLAESENSNEITLIRNPQFWDKDNVVLEKIIFNTDKERAIQKYENGEVDAVRPISSQMRDFRDKEIPTKKDFRIFKAIGVEFIYINTKIKPFDDIKVRQALNLAIDRKKLNEQQISELPTYNFVPEMEDYENVKPEEFNPDKARKLLSEAGFPNGENFPEFEYAFNKVDSNKRVAEFINEQWKKELGINAKLKSMEWSKYLAYRSYAEYKGVARGGWIGDYADPYSFLHLITTPESVRAWEDGKYKELLDKTNLETNQAKRFELMAKAEKYLLEKQPVIPISNQFNRLLSKPYVKGLSINPEGKVNWREVSVDTEFSSK